MSNAPMPETPIGADAIDVGHVARVAVVTDSNAMIPWGVAEVLGIVVVPLTIVIGDRELVEDRDLDVRESYRLLRRGDPAATSAPSPGAFAETYTRLAGGPIVSVHIGSNFSGTANAARLGAAIAGIDVQVVDTGAASFLAGCCVLAAAEAADAGGDVAAVVRAAERTAAGVETIFTLTEIDRARAGGRFVDGTGDAANPDAANLDAANLDAANPDAAAHGDRSLGDGAPRSDGVPVIRLVAGAFERMTTVVSEIEAADVMFEAVNGIGGRLRIGVGDADAGSIADELFDRLRIARPDDDLIRYVVGPTVAAHAGMGTFGIVYHALDDGASDVETDLATG